MVLLGAPGAYRLDPREHWAPAGGRFSRTLSPPALSIASASLHEMPTYDAKTGLYSSPLPSVKLPETGLSLYDFVFEFKGMEGTAERPDATNATWLIDAPTGKTYTRAGALERTDNIARAFHSLGVGPGKAVTIFSSNEIDYGPALWATHRLGAVVSCANPQYRASELTYQLDIGQFGVHLLLFVR